MCGEILSAFEMIDQVGIKVILKYLRQFVQSDWFLPIFISHDKDRRGMFAPRTHLAGLIH